MEARWRVVTAGHDRRRATDAMHCMMNEYFHRFGVKQGACDVNAHRDGYRDDVGREISLVEVRRLLGAAIVVVVNRRPVAMIVVLVGGDGVRVKRTGLRLQ